MNCHNLLVLLLRLIRLYDLIVLLSLISPNLILVLLGCFTFLGLNAQCCFTQAEAELLTLLKLFYGSLIGRFLALYKIIYNECGILFRDCRFSLLTRKVCFLMSRHIFHTKSKYLSY